jgi:hypothetical protein
MIHNNLNGLLLDRNHDRITYIDLPQVKRTKSLAYDGEVLGMDTTSYGGLLLTGDWHIGANGFSPNVFNAYIKLIKDNPYIRVGLMGDYIEYACNTGFIADENMDVDEQMDYFVAVLKKIKDQVAFVLAGNHGSGRMARYTQSKRWLRGLCAEAGLSPDIYIGEPDRGVTATIKSGEMLYSMYAIHGSSGAQNKFYQLEKMARSHRQTVLAMGHNHHLDMKSVLYDETAKIEDWTNPVRDIRMQHLVCSGTFMKDAGYAESRSYPMNVIGAPLLRFYSDTNEVDMWRMPYRSQYFNGGIASPITPHESPRRIEKKCLL